MTVDIIHKFIVGARYQRCEINPSLTIEMGAIERFGYTIVRRTAASVWITTVGNSKETNRRRKIHIAKDRSKSSEMIYLRHDAELWATDMLHKGGQP